MASSPAPAIWVSPSAHQQLGRRISHQGASPTQQPPASGLGFDTAPATGATKSPNPSNHPSLESSWPFNNNPNWQGFGRGDPGMGGRAKGMSASTTADPQEVDPARRPSMAFTITPARIKDVPDAGGSKTSSEDGLPSMAANWRLQSEQQLGQRSHDTSSHAYDRGLLSRIGGPNTPMRMPSVTSVPGDLPSVSPSDRDVRPQSLQRLSIPERRRSSNDTRLIRNSSTTSITSQPSFRSSSIFEAPDSQARMSVKRHTSFGIGERSPLRASHDSAISQGGPFKDLRIHDRSPGGNMEPVEESRAGMKRRASSPQGEELGRASVGSISSVHDFQLRQPHLHPSDSPGQRYSASHFSSISSASSFGPRTASSSSSHKLSIASSATSYTPTGHLSPHLLSPAIDLDNCSPNSANKPQMTSPRASVPGFSGMHRQSIDQVQHFGGPLVSSESMRRPSGVPGLLICDCCPKKPKKFSTEQDLRLHHMEKQYTCLYCPNRFKNKNEAERHQNSLHLRRHSWSCAALPSIEQAFHPAHAAGSEQSGPDVDICGYCGAEFPNLPRPDWEKRRYHLLAEHKFGECNQAKKFFRTDHFRQHLKHSHAGTSGKWTNVLENACMREEPAPPVLMRPEYPSSGGQAFLPRDQPSGQVLTDRIEEER